MTLAEKFKEETGSVGEYKWSVEVWRRQTRAKVNMVVILTVHRTRPWWHLGSGSVVYRDQDSASVENAEPTVEDFKRIGEETCKRFEEERQVIE